MPVHAYYSPKTFREVEAPRFRHNRLMKVVRLPGLRTDLQKIFLVLISITGLDDPRPIVWPKGLSQWKIPMTPSGIEPAIFQLVAHRLNQLRHRVAQTDNDIDYETRKEL